MANTLNLGTDGNWGTKENSLLGYNSENNNFKPLPFDFTRASNGTRVNKAGLIETVGNGIPRIDFLGNTEGALLLEPQRTNLITQSESFTNSYWTKSGASIQGDASTAGVDLLSGWDFTSGWTSHQATIINATSFSGYNNSGIYKSILENGKTYKMVVEGNTTSANGTIVADFTESQNYINLPNGTFSETFYFKANGTNLFLSNNSFGTTTYTTLTIQEVQGFASPSADSPLGAFKLVEDTSNGIHRLKAIGLNIVADRYNFSVFVKPNGRNEIRISGANYFSGGTDAYFNLETKVITYGARAGNGLIETLANGWFRCSFSSISGEVVGNNAFVYIDTALNGSNSYQGDGTSGVYIFGAQFEQGSYPTSYIKTEGSAVTRLADSCSNGGNEQVINSTEGVLEIKLQGLINGGDSRKISISDGTNDNRIFIKASSTSDYWELGIEGTNGGLINDNFTTSLDQTLISVIKLKWKSGDIGVKVDDVEVYTNSSTFTMQPLTKLQFQKSSGNGDVFLGKIYDLKIYNNIDNY